MKCCKCGEREATRLLFIDKQPWCDECEEADIARMQAKILPRLLEFLERPRRTEMH